MLALHRERGALATIALHHVEDARAFGLDPRRSRRAGTGVPGEARPPIPGDINAGTYLLDPVVLAAVDRRSADLDRARCLPGRDRGGTSGVRVPVGRYWIDLGTPAQVPAGALRPVRRARCTASRTRRRGSTRRPRRLRAHLGSWVAVGPGAAVHAEAQVEDSVIHRGGTIEAGARVVASVVGPGARVGAGATLMGCVLGEGSGFPEGADLDGARVPAGTEAVPE